MYAVILNFPCSIPPFDLDEIKILSKLRQNNTYIKVLTKLKNFKIHWVKVIARIASITSLTPYRGMPVFVSNRGLPFSA